MSYLHVPNLYKDQTILALRECYALEKIHGTSAHISFRYIPPKGLVSTFNGLELPVEKRNSDGSITLVDSAKPTAELKFSSGGESYNRFVALFDQEKLKSAFLDLGITDKELIIYGEAYGGKQQGMSHTYGNDLRFIVFDIQIGDLWLAVPQADEMAQKLGLEFVPYAETSTDLKDLDAWRDAPSVQAIRNGISQFIPGFDTLVDSDKPVEHSIPLGGIVVNAKRREGVVLRPLFEVRLNGNEEAGHRLIAKHKGDEFKETKTARKVVDPALQQVMTDSIAIAEEWSTASRLGHVLDKLPGHSIEKMRDIIAAMQEDVKREGAGEVIWSEAVAKAIGKKTVELYKAYLKTQLCQKSG